MPQLSEVRQALKRIGDGAFQELGDLLFYYIYRLNDIESRGSVIKKCKTKKGSPDTILTDSKGRLIFIEYTTQERGSGNAFYRKLEDDIKSCFNLRKTKIQPSSIYKIILCHTERLASDEKEKLVALCKSYNDKCLLESRGVDFLACELQKHPALLKNLGIKVGTGQIQESIDFIEEYENPSLKLATPLSNIFLGREKELEDGLAHLSNNDILVVTGAPGVGKTKISLELCRRYCQTHKKTHFLCVTDKGESIIDDFYLKVVPNRDYILFVDDANRTGHFKSILSLIRDKSKNIKVVATVRDYAKSKIGEQTLEYEKVQSLNIQNLSNDEITKILESDSFKIRNSRFKKRILDIANGNIRIALMCARIALEKKNLMVLSNAEQMYDAYFDEPYKYILNNDGLGREALKILGILSFFKVIKKDNVEIISKILFIFNIEESIFWSICSKLDNDEIVDLYENEAVKMSDQVFSTYLFYKVFFKERLLDLSLLIENFFDYRNSLIDSINPVLSCFDAEKDQETIKKIVVGIWREKFATKCDEEKITYLEMFSTFLRMETFAYLKMHIAKIPDSPEGTVYNFAYKDKDFIYKRVNNNILSLINAFRYEKKEEMTYALDLLFMYLEKKPELITEVIYMFKEYWSYDLNDHEIAYERQMCLFDYLIKKSKYSKICKGVNDAIIPHFMQFFFHIDEYKKRNFIFYSYPLQPSDDLFLLRKCIWDYINLESNRELFKNIILSLYNNFYRDEVSCRKIAMYDKKYIVSFLEKEDFCADYHLCKSLNSYFDKLKYLKIKIEPSLYAYLTNKYYILEQKIDMCKESKVDIKEKRRHLKLLGLCKGYAYNDYIELFKNLDTLEKLRNNGATICEASCIMENIISKNEYSLFYKLLQYIVSNCSYSLLEYRLLEMYWVKVKQADALFLCLQSFPDTKKWDWILLFLETIPDSLIAKTKDTYITFLFSSILKSARIPHNLGNIIDKYSSRDCIANYEKILDLVFDKYQKGNRCNLNEDFLLKCIDLCPSKWNIIKELYFINKSNPLMHFDSENKLLLKLLSIYPSFIIEYHESPYFSIEERKDWVDKKLELIWDLDNYKIILDETITYFIKNEKYFANKEVAPLFVNITNIDKVRGFIFELIDKYNTDIKYMYYLFLIIIASLGREKVLCYMKFIQTNKDISRFKELPIESHLFTGSRAGYCNHTLQFLKELMIQIKDLMDVDYIDHLSYLENEKDRLNREQESWAKIEYINNMYD